MVREMKRALIELLGLAILVVVIFGAGYQKGWNSHAEWINKQAAQKRANAEARQEKSGSALVVADDNRQTEKNDRVKEIIKYVKTKDRSKCDYDPEYIRLRSRSISADTAAIKAAGGSLQPAATSGQQ